MRNKDAKKGNDRENKEGCREKECEGPLVFSESRAALHLNNSTVGRAPPSSVSFSPSVTSQDLPSTVRV